MSWLSRSRPTPETDRQPGAGGGEHPAAEERAAPGIAALFDGLKPDGSHAVLDLGPGTGGHLRLYRPFARQVGFADLVPEPPRGPGWAAALKALPPRPGRPYDIVLLWNVFDRLAPAERSVLMDRVVELTGPGARLYTVVESSETASSRPMGFTLLDLERISQEPLGPPEPARERVLPAEVERLLSPFEVMRAFTLRLGWREYVAVRRRS